VRFKSKLFAAIIGISVFIASLLLGGITPVVGSEDGTNSFESYNYPGFYIRHQNGLGEITEVSSDLDKQDATFRLVRGLVGECSSFESVNYSGYYLRHQNSRVKLASTEDTDLFQNDATFCLRNGLANSANHSFESYNYPGYYIRHRNGHLYVEQGRGDLFNRDATFKLRSALWD
jgi:hypothetical protein